jgi:hypothetical protein
MDSRRRPTFPGLSLAALLCAASAVGAIETAQAKPASRVATSSPNPGSTGNTLTAVSAVSHADAWTVGEYFNDKTGAQDTLILHWNGTRWSKVASPNPGSTHGNVLSGVSALSRTNAWAVGGYGAKRFGETRTLILHWNGGSWSRVGSPNPSSTNDAIFGVGAISSARAWAVGLYFNDRTGAQDTLILHWNGSRWSKVRSPAPGSTYNYLSGVSAVSSTNAWAVGQFRNNKTGAWRTLILHWNGSRWSRVRSPNPSSSRNLLAGVTAVSRTNAWAVGQFKNNKTGAWRTLILHWNGSRWSRARSPNPSSSQNVLSGVSAVSATNAWAVGEFKSNKTGAWRTLVLHRNGKRWARARTPSRGASENTLAGVDAISATRAWAVGTYVDGKTGAQDTLILRWNGTRWSRS